jgi:Transmembrane secretion effector
VTEGLGTRFAKLWTASTTSALGSGVAVIAAPLFVAAHNKNPLVVSATFAVSWLPWLLFALPGGVLVDRVDRRRLMVTIDWTRVAAMSVLAAALLAGWSSIVLLDSVLFVINAGEAIFRSASQAMIQAVVPRARLERANSWLVGGTIVMQQMVAGPLGGFLFVLAACVPFFVNAGTYAASAVLAVGYGTLFACEAVGGLIGSAAGDWLIRTVTATWTIRIGLLVEASFHLTLAVSRSAVLDGLLLFAFGLHGALWTIVSSSLRQRLAPPEMLGRVASTYMFVAAAGESAGAILGGVVAARFGITAPYWVGFVVAALVAAATWRVFNRASVAQAYAEPALAAG